jgi:hypothetical protein
MIIKTVLITGSIAVIVALCVTLLTLFGPSSIVHHLTQSMLQWIDYRYLNF